MKRRIATWVIFGLILMNLGSPHHFPIIILSPQGLGYFVPLRVEVNAPFFCLVHGVGFVSRIGMIDHLSGTHKFPLTAAATGCPEANKRCIFPSRE